MNHADLGPSFSTRFTNLVSRIGVPSTSRGSFARHVAVLAGGTTLAQCAAIAASPLITRIYGPHDFGTLAAFSAVASIIVVAASFRLEVAIPLPEDDIVAANLLAASCLLAVTTSVVLYGVLRVIGPLLKTEPHLTLIARHSVLLPLSVLGGSLYQALNYWAIRRRAFVRIARTRVAQTLAQLAAQVGFGLLLSRSTGLLVADVVGRSAGSGTLALAARREDSVALRRISWSGVRRAVTEYKAFPQFASGAALLNAAGLNLAPLFMTGMFGSDVAGQFALSSRVLGLPMALIGDAVAQVYLGKASQLARENPRALIKLLSRMTLGMAALAAPPLLIILVTGPTVFRIVFGAAWEEAGVFVRILTGMVFVQLFVVPVSQTLNVLNKQHWQLGWDISRVLLVVGSFLLAGHLRCSPRMTLATYALFMVLAYLVLLALVTRAVRSTELAR